MKEEDIEQLAKIAHPDISTDLGDGTIINPAKLIRRFWIDGYKAASEYIEGLEIIHKAYQHILNKYPEIKENKPLYTEEEVLKILAYSLYHEDGDPLKWKLDNTWYQRKAKERLEQYKKK